MLKKSLIILSQLNSKSKNANHSYQLPLSLASPQNSQKPQIVSVPGISPKERNRYRVVVGTEILADGLTADEAFELTGKGGAR
jgi:hypothetical protein